MSLQLVGLDHLTAPVAFRERLYFSKVALTRVLPLLRELPGVEEAVVLSTCNRTEVYFAGAESPEMITLLAEMAHVAPEELVPHLYHLEDVAVAEHLFRVATGLCSLVIGETQILGQVAEALEIARGHGCAGRQVEGLFQQALATGKRARSETAISEGAFSVGRVAVEMARQLFSDLSDSPVLVIGAGKMSEISARHLAARGAQPILVANRTHAHAVELASRLEGMAIAYAELEEKLAEVDIVISSTSAPHTIIPRSTIASVMERRGGRPLFLIDIAIPRDIDAAVADIPHVHLYNIDDLQAVSGEYHQQRQEEIPKVEAIIDEQVDSWKIWQAGQRAAGIIAALHQSYERVRQDELSRAATLLSSLTPEQRQAVEALTASIVRKLLHTPTVRFKDLLTRECQANSLVCELFDLPRANEATDVEVEERVGV
ncbi:MAG: glutamyl-tRNA reductase [Armatimonadota bacterium]